MSEDAGNPSAQYCTIRPEFRDAGEAYAVYLVIEDNGDRLKIQPVEWNHGSIVPIETVGRNMIDFVRLDDARCASGANPDMPPLPQHPAAVPTRAKTR